MLFNRAVSRLGAAEVLPMLLVWLMLVG